MIARARTDLNFLCKATSQSKASRILTLPSAVPPVGDKLQDHPDLHSEALYTLVLQPPLQFPIYTHTHTRALPLMSYICVHPWEERK